MQSVDEQEQTRKDNALGSRLGRNHVAQLETKGRARRSAVHSMDDGRAVKGEKVVGGNVNVIGAGGETTDNMYTLHRQYMYYTRSTNVRANEPLVKRTEHHSHSIPASTYPNRKEGFTIGPMEHGTTPI